MTDTNVVVLKGRLTRTCELKYTQSQRPFVNFSIAVNDSIKNANTGEWENRPSYFDVTVWGKYGESVAKYLVKGREVLVQGKLRQDRWQGSDGKTQSRINVISENLELLREPKGRNAQAENLPPPPPADTPSFDQMPPSAGPFAPPQDSDNPFDDAQPVF